MTDLGNRPAFEVAAGSFEQGLANGRRLLADHPHIALEQAQTLLRVRPDAAAHRLAAAALRQMDEANRAETEELAAIRRGLADPVLNEVAALFEAGRLAEARQASVERVRADPDDLLARTLAAEAALKFWDLAQAEHHLRLVRERAPSFLRAAMLMATCLARQARLGEAIRQLEEVIDRKPGNAAALTYLAQLAGESGDVERAAATYEVLVTNDPTRAEHWIHLAQFRRMLGRRADAVAAFRQALIQDPRHGSAWWGLANYYPEEIGGEDEAAMAAAATEPTSAANLGALHLALANLADRRGEWEAAIAHFIEGKKLRLAEQPYDPDAAAADIDAAVAAFTPALVAAKSVAGSATAAPVFILGMPRSGSTLVMRILGRHPGIEDAGELPLLPRLAEALRFGVTGGRSYGDMLTALTTDQLKDLAENYCARANDYRRTDKTLFVDKLNLNWLHAGLVRLAMPGARIIDVRRGALDCCWSNFKMLFAQGHPAANDLGHIGRFYRDYVRMIDAVDAAAPGGILRVRYEDVVDNIECETRRMLTFLGLDFDPACIAFHEGGEAIATASSEQVRKPLNRAGIGSSEPYRPWLGKLIDALGPLA